MKFRRTKANYWPPSRRPYRYLYLTRREARLLGAALQAFWNAGNQTRPLKSAKHYKMLGDEYKELLEKVAPASVRRAIRKVIWLRA